MTTDRLSVYRDAYRSGLLAAGTHLTADSTLEAFAEGYATAVVSERAISDDLLAALKEARCWIPDGSRFTPEQRGAKKETTFGVEEMIDSTIAKAEHR